MEKRGFKWQIFLGLLLLAGVIGCLFLPRMEVTGDRYLSVAMEVNRMAEQKNMEAARQGGTAQILDNYERGTSKRAAKASAYQKEINRTLGSGSHALSGMELLAWCFTSDGSIDFQGVVLDSGRDARYGHVEEIYRLMGIVLLSPCVLSAVVMTIMLIRRKTQRFLMFITGLFTIGAHVAWLEVIPGLLWERVSDYVVSLDMVSEQVMQIEGVGEYSIRMILLQFAGQGYYMGCAMGGALVITALLFWTAWRPYSRDDIQEELFLDAAAEAEPVEQWEIFADNPLPEKQIQIRQPGEKPVQPVMDEEAIFPMQMDVKGYLHGVRGQYAGYDFEIEPGREIVLGRDAEFCDVVFDAPGISRRHCGIRFDELTGQYRVIDYSVTGTTMSNGKTASAGGYMVANPGTIVYLGREAEAIRLG